MAQKRVKQEKEEKTKALERERVEMGKPTGKRPSNPKTHDSTTSVPVAVGYAVQPQGGAMHEFTTSTFIGLYVTVESTLSLTEYLAKDPHYCYLLTRRLNQDALEVSA